MIDSISKGSLGLILMSWCAICANAQDPTFSFEASKVNGVKLQNGPSGEIQAVPGDLITVDIRLRDWSPNGTLLRAYQASIDQRGFTSGFHGTIQPLNYAETTAKGVDNKQNCYIDTNNPNYIFAGRQNFGITDTISSEYRWMGALVDPDECMLSKQDGKKFYCGTVILKVSDKANGPFTIRFLEPEWASSLRDTVNQPIPGLSFEPLVINVGAPILRVVGSEIESGSIDGRVHSVLGGNAGKGWSRFVLRANIDDAIAKNDDFVIADGSASPPKVKSVQVTGRVITLDLDRPITPGAWTSITHKPSGTGVRFGSLAGDVNGDGTLATDDLANLIQVASGRDSLPVYRTDLDGNGSQSPNDLIRMIDLLAQPNAYRSRIKN